jgi:hypothetical protein
MLTLQEQQRACMDMLPAEVWELLLSETIPVKQLPGKAGKAS